MRTRVVRESEKIRQWRRDAVKWASRVLAACALVGVISAQGVLADPVAPQCWGGRSYSFQTTDPPFGTPGVDMAVQILWMNNSGVVSAQYQKPPDPNWFANMHTAVRHRGRWTNIDVPGAITTGGTSVNSRGQIVLSYLFSWDEPFHAALYDRRGLHPFPELPDYPGGIIGQGLNDRGQIAGFVIDADWVWHAFVGDRDDYEIVDYPDPDAASTWPMCLNNRGTTVGFYGLPDGSNRGFWYQRGQFGAIDVPDAVNTWPSAINNSGVVVGNYESPAPEWLGFVLERGRFTDFRVPDASWTNICFINDRGQISGIYGDADGITHGYVATPARSGPKHKAKLVR